MNYLAIIPTIVSFVKAIEDLMPTSTGKEKLEAVVTAIEAVFGALTDNLPKIEGLIGVIVKAFNLLGVFKKKTAEA